jgi:hypothetical protein
LAFTRRRVSLCSWALTLSPIGQIWQHTIWPDLVLAPLGTTDLPDNGQVTQPVEAAVARYRAALAAVETTRQAAAQAAAERVARARGKAEAARLELAAAIVAAARAGVRQRDLVQASGYTRETIRVILRAAGE